MNAHHGFPRPKHRQPRTSRGLAHRIDRLVLGLVLLTGCCLAECTPDQPAERDSSQESPAAGQPSAPEQHDTSASAPSPAPSPADTLRADSAWTAGIASEPAVGDSTATLQAVRTARHAGFDRTVFVFEGDDLPGYHVEYIDRPVRQCGSGNPVSLAGDGWLEVRFQPARAHTASGAPTVTDRTRAPDLPVLKELTLTCDFEADVTWVLGVASPNRYRLQRLAAPARLAVDIRH